MQVFTSTIQQMALLLIFMIIGYILSKAKIVPDNASGVLSKLENNVFTPASILGTFLANFTVSKLSGAWQYLLVGTIVVLVSIPIAMLVSKMSSKDDYTKKIYAYGLIFSNFGFMGNAVVSSVYGNEVYMSYLVFVIPFWIGIYAWAVPTLLMPSNAGQSI
jgi:predicted permease